MEKFQSTVLPQPQSYDMVVFCHLRWDFVYQRPQHLISRMAKEMKILMIEEPWHRPEETTSRLTVAGENLHILQPNVTSIEAIETVLPFYISPKVTTAWFYSPSFMPLLSYFEADTIVYDCMDELSLFKGAPQELIDREQALLDKATVVFTGGKSLYEAKAKLHSNVYCFPSSVDEAHFAQAQEDITVPADMAGIKGPVVGYCGVIDERINLDLLAEAAALRPEMSFAMIGPLAKIGEHDLPRRENIHYLGMKGYEELPSYLKGFDIAMMPFALNDATKYISPTKTLEYMAAGKPIISTAIKDVVRDYSNCVNIVATAEDFAGAISKIQDESPDVFMRYEYREILKKTSWDTTAGKMKALIKVTAAA